MTDTQREAFEAACNALPEGVNWGDPITPEIAQHIRQAAQAADAGRDVNPVAWRYKTPTGWHATTDCRKALGASVHHEMEPLCAASPVAAINAELVEALEALLGPEDDPHIGWWATSLISDEHFRCEHCGVEDLDSAKLRHKDDCRVVKARAALLRAKEQKS